MAAAILFWLSIQQERWLIVVDLDTGLSFLSKKVFFFTSNVSCIADSMARNDRLPFIGRVIHPFQAQLDTELSLHVNELALVIHFFTIAHSRMPFMYSLLLLPSWQIRKGHSFVLQQ